MADWTKDEKKFFFLTALVMMIKKDPTTFIRKHANELKVLEKTLRTWFKQRPQLPWLRFRETKTNATSHPTIGSLKTAIEKK